MNIHYCADFNQAIQAMTSTGIRFEINIQFSLPLPSKVLQHNFSEITMLLFYSCTFYPFCNVFFITFETQYYK